MSKKNEHKIFSDDGIGDEGQGREAVVFELAVLRCLLLDVPQILFTWYHRIFLNSYSYYID